MKSEEDLEGNSGVWGQFIMRVQKRGGSLRGRKQTNRSLLKERDF